MLSAKVDKAFKIIHLQRCLKDIRPISPVKNLHILRNKQSVASTASDKLQQKSLKFNEKQDVPAKTIIASKSVSKIPRTYKRPESAMDAFNTESRQSLNLLAPESKYLIKTSDRKQYEPPSSLLRNGATSTLSTQSNFKTSGKLTARAIYTKPLNDEKSSIDNRVQKNGSKKLRTKSRGEIGVPRDNSSTSSKLSSKCPSSLSKSNSQRKEKSGVSRHMKKKSAAIPTRSTKTLYSTRAEYENKRNSKAVIE